MQEYGLSGSATYSVELDGLDPMMQILPDNNVNQISARNIRDIVYTLWLNGGGGSEFFYTQGPPLTEKSTAKVGGVLSNRNFENVSLQVLFDTMFFEPISNTRSIVGSGSFEYGFPSPTINITVNLGWKNTNNYTNATVKRTSANGVVWSLHNTFLVPPTRPTSKGASIDTNYTNTPVAPNSDTTWTLVTFQNGVADTGLPVYATWYFRRFWGWVDLSSFGSSFKFFDATDQQKLDINGIINDNYIKNPLFGKSQTTQIGTVNFEVDGVKHLWFAWPKTDYGGDGEPNTNASNVTGFRDGIGQVINFFKLLKFQGSPTDATRSFVNQYGYLFGYNIYISDNVAGSGSYTVGL